MAQTSRKKIESQLGRILGSLEFTRAEKLSQFLRFVVEQSLDGNSGNLKQYTIAVEGLGYGSDFDPETDSIVRIQARRLRRALDTYYDGKGRDDPIRIQLPKGGYSPVYLDNSERESAETPANSTSARCRRRSCGRSSWTATSWSIRWPAVAWS